MKIDSATKVFVIYLCDCITANSVISMFVLGVFFSSPRSFHFCTHTHTHIHILNSLHRKGSPIRVTLSVRRLPCKRPNTYMNCSHQNINQIFWISNIESIHITWIFVDTVHSSFTKCTDIYTRAKNLSAMNCTLLLMDVKISSILWLLMWIMKWNEYSSWIDY